MAIVFRRFSVLYLEWHTKLFARCDYLPFDMNFAVVIHEVLFQLHIYRAQGIGIIHGSLFAWYHVQCMNLRNATHVAYRNILLGVYQRREGH